MEPAGADEFLIEQIRQGSASAWRQLIERYQGRLLAFARTRLGSRPDAEDLVQETFVGLIQSLGNFDTARSLETYLFTIIRYKLIDRLRSRRVAPVCVDAADERWWDQVLPQDADTPARAVLLEEDATTLGRSLEEVLRRLIRDYRDRGAFDDLQVIELLFFAGRRNLDVAELFELDQKSVAGIKFRAIAKLRKFLTELGESGAVDLPEEGVEVTVARIWRSARLTCLKRNTLGSYLLGVLDDPWLSYTRFHLDVVACPMCLANMADLETEEFETPDRQVDERIFASSVGFLSRPSGDAGRG